MSTEPKIPQLDSLQSYLKASNEDGVCIIEGTATWCSQCQAIAPEYEKMLEEFPKARFYQFDTDKVPDIAQELGISMMPTFKIFKDGDLMDSVTGAKAKELRDKIQENLK